MMWMESLAVALEDQGWGTRGVDLWLGMLRDDANMGLTTALSLEPGNVILVGGGHVDRSLLVLEVRGPSFESAFERIEAIRTLLGSIANTTVHGSYFVGVSVTDTIQDMGRDAKERQVLSTRFEVIR